MRDVTVFTSVNPRTEMAGLQYTTKIKFTQIVQEKLPKLQALPHCWEEEFLTRKGLGNCKMIGKEYRVKLLGSLLVCDGIMKDIKYEPALVVFFGLLGSDEITLARSFYTNFTDSDGKSDHFLKAILDTCSDAKSLQARSERFTACLKIMTPGFHALFDSQSILEASSKPICSKEIDIQESEDETSRTNKIATTTFMVEAESETEDVIVSDELAHENLQKVDDALAVTKAEWDKDVAVNVEKAVALSRNTWEHESNELETKVFFMEDELTLYKTVSEKAAMAMNAVVEAFRAIHPATTTSEPDHIVVHEVTDNDTDDSELDELEHGQQKLQLKTGVLTLTKPDTQKKRKISATNELEGPKKQKTHTRKKSFPCKICIKVLTSGAGFKSHEKTAHPPTPRQQSPGTPEVVCQECGVLFKMTKTYQQHLINKTCYTLRCRLPSTSGQ